MIFNKNVPYFILHELTKFQSQTFFPSEDIKLNVLLSSSLRLIFNHPLKQLKQQLTWKKDGKMEIQKFEYLEQKKSFLDKIKRIFHNYLGLSFGEK